MKNISNEDKDWIESAIISGGKYGYPECCINEFVNFPPSKMNRNHKPSLEHLLRYKMGHINNVFSGFVPCLKHAKMIKSGEIKLEALIDIKIRIVRYPFPFDWSCK